MALSTLASGASSQVGSSAAAAVRACQYFSATTATPLEISITSVTPGMPSAADLSTDCRRAPATGERRTTA
ncbi:MAG: hypothetical protein P8Y69_04775 [Gammaproteobacteria bacterium]